MTDRIRAGQSLWDWTTLPDDVEPPEHLLGHYIRIDNPSAPG